MSASVEAEVDSSVAVVCCVVVDSDVVNSTVDVAGGCPVDDVEG